MFSVCGSAGRTRDCDCRLCVAGCEMRSSPKRESSFLRSHEGFTLTEPGTDSEEASLSQSKRRRRMKRAAAAPLVHPTLPVTHRRETEERSLSRRPRCLVPACAGSRETRRGYRPSHHPQHQLFTDRSSLLFTCSLMSNEHVVTVNRCATRSEDCAPLSLVCVCHLSGRKTTLPSLPVCDT